MRKPILFLVTAAWALTTSANSFAGNVSGQFTSSKKGTIRPTSVAAFPVRSPGDPLKEVLLVVLAEGTMDAVEAVKKLGPHTALINQEGMRKKNYISLWIRPDGFVSMNATFHEGMVQYMDSTKEVEGDGSILAQSLEADFSAYSADRVAARVRSSETVTTLSGDSYELDVEFDTSVIHPAAGKKLGTGGGEPGKVLQSLLNAIKTRDWKAVRMGVKSETLQGLVDPDASDEENFEYVVDEIAFLLPKGRTKVLGGKESSETAILELQGETTEGGVEALYLVRMLKEAAGWRFDRAQIAGFL